MDKEKYVEGLFAYYELGRIDVIKSAYVQGYVASASRYDTYVGRDRSAIELEVRRRVDIHACVKAYVETSIAQGRRLAGASPAEYVCGRLQIPTGTPHPSMDAPPFLERSASSWAQCGSGRRGIHISHHNGPGGSGALRSAWHRDFDSSAAIGPVAR